MKQWLLSLPTWLRYVVLILGAVLLNTVIVLLLSVILGHTDTTSLSNGFFYASSAMFLAAVVLYVAGRPRRPDLATLRRQAKEAAPAEPPTAPADKGMPMLGKAAALLLTVGFLLFGVSVLVGMLLA